MHPLTKEFFDNVHILEAEKVLPGGLYKKLGYPLLANWARLARVYDSLADEESRKIFRRSVTFRLLECFLPEGRIYDLYPLITRDTWAKLEEAARALPELEGTTIVDRIETRVLKGYEHPACHVCQGDVVLDVGAFTGDSSEYFAGQLKERGQGRIYSFEPHPVSFAYLKRNMQSHPEVICINVGCSDENGTAYLSDSQTGSTLIDKGIPVSICTIDSFVDEKGLERVDFIKMDIEGLEPKALAGARETIQRFHPKMAICIYHYSEHLFSIFEQICSYGDAYRFHIKNSQITRWGTVLFCEPVDKTEEISLPGAAEEAAMMKQLGELFLLQTELPVQQQLRFRELSTWECCVQLAKNFHLYRLLRPIYRRFIKKAASS